MMKIYSIFDDFDEKAIEIISGAGCALTVHPLGIPRPDDAHMKKILEEYDCVIIGTSQKITEEMFEKVVTPRIIATASVGLDHIKVPEEKKELVKIINTPKANAQSVAEYTMGCALACCKRLAEGRHLYLQGKNNKKLFQKPEDLLGKKLGVVGAGNISTKIMEYGRMFGMQVYCWTAHPESHKELADYGVTFQELDKLLSESDVISVNLPNNQGTKNLISLDRVNMMKGNVTFISVSRAEIVNYEVLFEKAKNNPGFYVCLDLDVREEISSIAPDIPNVLITPHIAGGTVETRKRMFRELAEQIASVC